MVTRRPPTFDAARKASEAARKAAEAARKAAELAAKAAALARKNRQLEGTRPKRPVLRRTPGGGRGGVY